MRGRRVGIVASATAGLAVLGLVVGVAMATTEPSAFVVGCVVVAVLGLVIGMLTGLGVAVGGAYVLAGVAAVASILAGGTGPVRAALVGLVLFVSAELARISLDARKPCRFDRKVLARIGVRVGLMLAAMVGFLFVLAVADDVSLPSVFVPAAVVAAVSVVGVLAFAGRLNHGPGQGRVVAAVVVLMVVGLAVLAAQSVGQDRVAQDPAVEESVEEVAPPVNGLDDETAADEDLDPGTVLTLRLVTLVLIIIVALLLGGALLLPGAELTLDPYELDPDDDLVLSGGAIADIEEIADEVGSEAAVAAIEEAIAELTSDLEPGLAVRLAYDTVQSGFGRDDLARGSSESESEYLGRLLTTLGVSGVAMRRLTDLFEQARFSEHRIDEGMRADAVDAFEAVRTELVAAAGTNG